MPGPVTRILRRIHRARDLARRPARFVLFALALLSFGAPQARAAWPTQSNVNLAVCTQPGIQIFRGVIPDGEGGMFVAWTDVRTGTADIYAQHISASGLPTWIPTGRLVCGAINDQNDPVLTTDGAGGVIVAWRDFRGGMTGDIYAQRVDASGTPRWTLNGVPVCTAPGEQALPVIASDERTIVPGPPSTTNPTGAIIAWEDWRSGITIRAQRVDGSGTVRWALNGLQMSSSTSAQFEPALVEDGSGGAFCVWAEQGLNGYDVGGQHVQGDGTLVWGGGAGLLVNAALGDQLRAVVMRDPLDGALVVWEDHRGADSDVYAQRLTYYGAHVWEANGLAVSAAPGDQHRPSAVPDRFGGFVAAWSDQRVGDDIFAQRVSAAGVPLWTAGGVGLCTAGNVQQYPALTADGHGGATVAWEDFRGGGIGDIYAQRVNGNGVTAWANNGIPVCNAGGNQYGAGIVSEGDTLAIVLWSDQRGSGNDIFAQRIPFAITLGVEPGDASLSFAAGPNPARGTVSFAWSLRASAHVELAIFDPAGRRVRALVRGVRPAGPGQIAWDARDEAGNACAAGVYFARLEVAGAAPVVRTITLRR